MAKRANERDSSRKIFDILLNRFGSGVQGHQAMVKFEKRLQRDDESIEKFLDDLELLRRRSNPDERISERNLAIASKFFDGVKRDELKIMLATHFTLSLDQVPTPDDLRMKSSEYLLIKPRAQNSKSSAILGRSFSLTQSGLCVSVLLNSEATTVTIQRGKKLFKADVFSKHKADIRCCKFVEHEIEIEEGSVPHREGARRMTPHKLEACRMLVAMLMEYDMIEPSKSPWACGVVMAKK